jgi:pilus assembly protein Flp/PilA
MEWSTRCVFTHVVPFLDQKGKVMFKSCTQFVRNFLNREDGPTAVEYAVMLALIIVVCITAITALGSNANATFTSVGNTIGGAS